MLETKLHEAARILQISRHRKENKTRKNAKVTNSVIKANNERAIELCKEVIAEIELS